VSSDVSSGGAKQVEKEIRFFTLLVSVVAPAPEWNNTINIRSGCPYLPTWNICTLLSYTN
ncbi:MAG: hypothetical protein OSA83_08840, partial [Pseudomonadales bacterium]|nr:hypothetical protein [Pseudomonadales bacterium]